MTKRGTTNRNQRGGSPERRRRREWLVEHFGRNGIVRCRLAAFDGCLKWLTVDTVSADRIKPGVDGGTYARTNIQPACPPCQSYTGGKLGAARAAANRAARQRKEPDARHPHPLGA